MTFHVVKHMQIKKDKDIVSRSGDTSHSSCTSHSKDTMSTKDVSHKNAISYHRNCDPENTNLHFDVGLKQYFMNKDGTRNRCIKGISIESMDLFTESIVAKVQELFLKLSHQLHLNVAWTSTDRLERYSICAKAGSRTRQVLFGSALLEVTQSIQVVCVSDDPIDRMLRIELHWYHPSLERSRWTLQGGSKGYHKRSRFIQLFNAAWNKMITMYEIVPDVLQRFSSLSLKSSKTSSLQSRTSSLLKKRSRSRMIEEEQFEHHNITINNTKKTSNNTTTTHKKFQSMPIMTTTKLNNTTATRQLPRKSSLKKRSSSSCSESSLSSTTPPKQNVNLRVSFSTNNLLAEVPLSVEEREARMGPGERATYEGGVLKPLRSSRTGEILWTGQINAIPVSEDYSSSSSDDEENQDEIVQKRIKRDHKN